MVRKPKRQKPQEHMARIWRLTSDGRLDYELPLSSARRHYDNGKLVQIVGENWVFLHTPGVHGKLPV
jgi:hypothetical protein